MRHLASRNWILGSGGQIGRRLVARLPADSIFVAPSPPWETPDQVPAYFDRQARAFAEWRADRPWRVFWLAGRAVVSSDDAQTAQELRAFDSLLQSIKEHLPRSHGVVFVGSSAGGVYAGSENPPFTRLSSPRPITPYGALKLDQERLAATRLGGDTSVVIGRMANVYGPTQKLTKPQGLITHLCQAAATRRPLKIYVASNTLRDYVYVDDVVRAIDVATWEATTRSGEKDVHVDILASGSAMSIARVIHVVQSVTHRRIPLAFGTDVYTDRQVHDLRLVPSPVMLRANAAFTPLEVGVRRVFDAMVTEPLRPTRV